MTTDGRPSSPAAPAVTPHPGGHDDWPTELLEHLPASCFPGTYDDLAAALLRQHAPSRLLWQLSVLPRDRRVESVDDLVARLAREAGSPAAAPVPM